MAEQLKLPVEFARDLATCATQGQAVDHWHGNDGRVARVVENRHTGSQNRWSSIHELVLQTPDGRLWKRLYTEGLTERQDERPFDYEGPEIPFDLVRAREVSRTEYDPVK